MRTRRIGDSDLQASVVGLGCNNFGSRCDAATSRQVIDAALDQGVTFFDTADVYGNRGGSESILGEALQGRRDAVVVATKFGADMGGPPDQRRGSRAYLRTAIAASLRRLRTDRVDLYQLHVPDEGTPIEETLGALDELVAEGKVRCHGSSNFTAWQVVDADWTARTRGLRHFVSAQNEYSLLRRDAEAELIPACLAHGIGVIPYFPLASGLLTGKYRRGQPAPPGTRLAARPDWITDSALDTVEALQSYAAARGRSLLEIAIGGVAARHGVVSVIAGATRPEQVTANVAAGAWEPSPEDLAALDQALAAVGG